MVVINKKNQKMKVYIMFIFFFITSVSFINASIVMLFGKPNFYELDIKRADDVHATNFEQSFSYLVGANGKCSSNSESILKLHDESSPSDYENEQGPIPEDIFKLDANILIYSNYEETMSFMIEIKFNSLKTIQRFEGFEIIFHQKIEDIDQINCIQLVPFKKEFLNLQNNYRIRIKDPSFMSYKPTHIFHFGHIIVRPLVLCNSDQAVIINGIKMCSYDNMRSRKKEIGIENNQNIDITNFKADICPGHLMDQTCIIKYPKSDTYYLILQPYTPYFNSILSDINFYTLTPFQQELKKEAEKNFKSLIKIGSFDYSSNITDGEFVHHIESMSRQKIFNGLIIKLVKYRDEAVHYMSVLKNPTSSNPCARNIDKSYCYCNGECKPCFYPDSSITEPSNYYYLALNYDKNPKHYKSSPCYKHPFFEPYFNLEKIEMAQYFQNKNLSLIKKAEYQFNKSIEILTPIRDYIPRMCLNIAYASNKNIFDLKIIFNDYYKTGLSSLFDGTKYKFKLFSYTYNDVIEHDLYFERKFFHNINPILIYDEPSLIDLTDLIKIENLVYGAYIIEITPYQNTSLCSLNSCLVESPMANQVQCIKCNKLVVHFLLENGMIRVNTDVIIEPVKNGNKNLNNNNNNKNPLNSKNSNSFRHSSSANKKLKIIIQKSFSLYKDDSMYKCSIEGNTISYYGNSITNNLNNIYNIRSKFDKYKIYSSAIPNDIDLSNISLPYVHVPDQQTDNNDYFILKILSIIGLVLIIFFLMIIALFYIIKQPTWNIKKQVVFYLSIDIEPEIQKKLGKLIDKYILKLKKNFSKMEFYNFGYHTQISLRNEVMENCDLIFYVCGTQKEIEKLNKKYIGFGTNIFQHDYNKMHFLKSFENKCFNITFNECIRDLNESQYVSTQINCNSEVDSSSKSIYSKIPQATVVSPTSNGKKAILLNRTTCLKLPEHNGHLISLIAQKMHFDMITENKKYDYRNRKRSNKLIAYLNDLYLNNSLKQLKKSLDTEAKKYLKANNVISTLNQNIDHDVQPIQINIIEEFENDLDESQKDFESIKTFDSSSISSYSKNSNNSAN